MAQSMRGDGEVAGSGTRSRAARRIGLGRRAPSPWNPVRAVKPGRDRRQGQERNYVTARCENGEWVTEKSSVATRHPTWKTFANAGGFCCLGGDEILGGDVAGERRGRARG